MDVFKLHDDLIGDYVDYTRSFLRIHDERINAAVTEAVAEGLLWPNPLLQLNPSFEPGNRIDELVDEGILHPECSRIFRIKSPNRATGERSRSTSSASSSSLRHRAWRASVSIRIKVRSRAAFTRISRAVRPMG